MVETFHLNQIATFREGVANVLGDDQGMLSMYLKKLINKFRTDPVTNRRWNRPH